MAKRSRLGFLNDSASIALYLTMASFSCVTKGFAKLSTVIVSDDDSIGQVDSLVQLCFIKPLSIVWSRYPQRHVSFSVVFSLWHPVKSYSFLPAEYFK